MPKLVLKVGSRPPWVGLAAAVWTQIASGNAYNFPLYSSALKSVLGLNQQQVTILGVANDVGENMALLPGIASNKFPPWALLLLGSLLSLFGYGLIWLAVSQTLSQFPYLLLWLALCVATNSSAWFSTAVLVTNMRNFPLSRGTISGILKGYAGISAAVYTLIYSMLLKSSASELLLFLAIGIPVVCLVMMYFVRPCTPPSGEDSSVHVHFIFVQVASVLLASYLVITTIVSDMVSIDDAVSYILVAIMVILLMTPLAIPVKMTLFPANSKRSNVPLLGSSDQLLTGDDVSTQTSPLLTPSSSAANLGSFHESEDASDVETLIAEGEGAIRKKRRPKRGDDFKFREALVKADFWLLWFAYFLGVGSGVTVLNNLAQIGVALGVEDTTILLSVFSFCNFMGRLGAGIVSEHFVRLITLPRTFWMTSTQIIMIVAFLLYASALDGTLYAATALLGICYGVQYSIMIPTVSELFGLRHFGVISSVMMLGNPIGALIFSVFLAGNVYDAEAANQGNSTCYGATCFRLTFLVLAGVCGLGTILSIILTLRIRPVYQMLYAGGSFRLSQTSNH
ncbi:protein NUCLEAR FUSION DEFECTIVE 4 [Cajanus cajan]|uniref:Inner membrane protein yhjX n=1 Tax=Cajanus cajan TaxID=3821 RepID=A0A151SPN2_CAJCA|nr:protein NUCLEAR FUSION DEFECTIVE 4 [Cajanus cajan]KYP56777.1 Inner membrane protein yhjX [Cajanus cajan]